MKKIMRMRMKKRKMRRTLETRHRNAMRRNMLGRRMMTLPSKSRMQTQCGR